MACLSIPIHSDRLLFRCEKLHYWWGAVYLYGLASQSKGQCIPAASGLKVSKPQCPAGCKVQVAVMEIWDGLIAGIDIDMASIQGSDLDIDVGMPPCNDNDRGSQSDGSGVQFNDGVDIDFGCEPIDILSQAGNDSAEQLDPLAQAVVR